MRRLMSLEIKDKDDEIQRLRNALLDSGIPLPPALEKASDREDTEKTRRPAILPGSGDGPAFSRAWRRSERFFGSNQTFEKSKI